MYKLLHIWKWISTHFNKYQIVFFAFLIFMTFIDENNLIRRYRLSVQQRELHKEVKLYRDKISHDITQLEELDANDTNLEKFAREHYLMKKDDEEIFILE